ncbi:NYN domain-containing protein [Methylomarinum vadi]|uniref:NYN domain-containing protein n=1 Tax=Methylomarinum vadi TaxID=438855 RepID=UPI0004DF870D|nr:NYN domain-containing protein [Methylomarinum vadi]
MLHTEKKLAVLIDAENTQLSALEAIMTELAKYGYVIVKRAYGDWASSGLKNWKNTLNELAIQPIQQFSYTQGKNSSDAAMIIDAMDLLYSNKFNAFALISSDSDFTKLATRLKESQIHVYGVGERKTPIAFRNACDDFLYIDVLKSLSSGEEDKPSTTTPQPDQDSSEQPRPYSRQQLCQDAKLINALRNAAEECSEDDGWAELGVCGSLIKRQFPDFDSRNYGYAKLSTLIETTKLFDLKKEKMPDSNHIKLYYRDKKKHGK